MPNFSTVDRVRQVAGFASNEDITDADIQLHMDRASNLIRSSVSGRYALSTLSGANYTGSAAAEYLATAEEMIAAGLLLMQEYGERDPERTGQKKYSAGMAMLKDLRDGTAILLGVDEAPLTALGASATLSEGVELTGPTLDDSPRKFGVDDSY